MPFAAGLGSRDVEAEEGVSFVVTDDGDGYGGHTADLRHEESLRIGRMKCDRIGSAGIPTFVPGPVEDAVDLASRRATDHGVSCHGALPRAA